MRRAPYLRLVEPSQPVPYDPIVAANDDISDLEVIGIALGILFRRAVSLAFWIALGLIAGMMI